MPRVRIRVGVPNQLKPHVNTTLERIGACKSRRKVHMAAP